jgi:nucleoside-diphosphate-sugar epimerase
MILVTGGVGYLGSRLVPRLLALGHRVRVVDTLWFPHLIHPRPGLEVVQANLTSFSTDWLQEVEHVVHLAGISNDVTAEFAPQLAESSNVHATREMATAVAELASRRDKTLRLILASTCSVYYQQASTTDEHARPILDESFAVHPESIYSRTKRAAELAVGSIRESHPMFLPVALRMGTLFGYAPRMRFDLVVNTFTLNAWQRRKLLLNGPTDIWRPLLHVDDAVDVFITLLTAPLAPYSAGVYNLLSRNCLISELAHEVAEVLQRERKVHIDIERAPAAGDGGRSYRVSGEKAAKVLGLRPTRDVKTAVLEMWDRIEAGEFGNLPSEDSRYFNIRWLKQSLGAPEFAG